MRRALIACLGLLLLTTGLPAANAVEPVIFSELTGFATKTGFRGVFAWEANQSVDAIVRFGTSPTSLTQSTKAIPGAPDTAGLAISDGLTIGSTYYWLVEDLATGTKSDISSFKAANAYNSWDGSTYTLNLLVQLDTESLPPGGAADLALENIAQGMNIFAERLYDAMDGFARLGKVLVTDTNLDFGVNIPFNPPGCFAGTSNAADVLVQTSVPFDSHTFSGWQIESPCTGFYVGRLGQLVVPWGFGGEEEDLHFGYVSTHELMHYAFNAPDLYNIANPNDPAGCNNPVWDGSLMHNSGGYDPVAGRWRLTELDRNPTLTPCDHQHNVNYTWDNLRVRYTNVPLRPAGPIENIVDARARGNPDGGALDVKILNRSPIGSDMSAFEPIDDQLFTNACVEPGFTVLTDPKFDSTDTTPERDVISASVAEPFELGAGKIVFIMKVASLQNLPASTSWPIYFKDPTGADLWVRMSTDPLKNVRFARGTGVGNAASSFTAPGILALPESSYSADGTIRMVFNRSEFGLDPGEALTNFLVRVRVESPHGGGLTPDNMPGSLTPAGIYTVRGSENCRSLPPVAIDDSAQTSEDVAVTVNVLANDSDPAGSPLTVASVSAPANGTALISGNAVRYTPSTNFNGSDSFTYQVSNAVGMTALGRVTVAVAPVQDVPDAFDDRLTMSADTSFRIPVLDNDVDPDGDALTIISVTDPPKGTAQANADGTVRYTPDPGTSGTDTFRYTISDGTGLDAANVTVQVIPAGAENPCVSPGLTILTDPANDQLAGNGGGYDITRMWAGGPFPSGKIQFTMKVAGPLNPPPVSSVWRVLFVVPGGTNYWVAMETNLTGVPTFNFGTRSGTALSTSGPADGGTFTSDGYVTLEINRAKVGLLAPGASVTQIQGRAERFVGAEGNGGFSSMDTTASTGTYTLPTCLTEPANDPPSAIDDNVVVQEDVASTLSVLANDTDRNGDPLSITAFSQGDHGSVVKSGNSLVYRPSANYNGADSFSYTISDGRLTASAVVHVSVAAVNDVPVAFDDSVSTPEDSAVTFAAAGNDSDIDGDALRVADVSAPLNGIAAVTSDGGITYTPNLNYNGADIFTYQVSDGAGGLAEATVHVTIAAVNDPPVAANDTVICDRNGAVTFAALANDSDVDDEFEIVSFGQPSHGTTRMNMDGSFTYTPRKSFVGTDSFGYVIRDESGATSSATVTISVAKPKSSTSTSSSSFSLEGAWDRIVAFFSDLI